MVVLLTLTLMGIKLPFRPLGSRRRDRMRNIFTDHSIESHCRLLLCLLVNLFFFYLPYIVLLSHSRLSNQPTRRQPRSSFVMQGFLFRLFFSLLVVSQVVMAQDSVLVETLKPGTGDPVTGEHRYAAMVTLFRENVADGTKTPSGWSTRKSDGAEVDKPFVFQPGVNLIKGWSEGVLQMREGERALLHVPSHLGYGSRPMGSPGGAFWLPADSDLLFDIEILGKEGDVKSGQDL